MAFPLVWSRAVSRKPALCPSVALYTRSGARSDPSSPASGQLPHAVGCIRPPTWRRGAPADEARRPPMALHTSDHNAARAPSNRSYPPGVEGGPGHNVPSPVVPKARTKNVGEGQGGGDSQTSEVGSPPTSPQGAGESGWRKRGGEARIDSRRGGEPAPPGLQAWPLPAPLALFALAAL